MSAAIHGIGWVTPLGNGLADVFREIRSGEPPHSSEFTDPASGASWPVYRVPDSCVSGTSRLPRLRRSSAISHFAVTAALDALIDADISPESLDKERTAVIFAATDGGIIYTRRFYEDIVQRNAGAGSPALFPETVYNAPASHIAARFGITGPVLTLVNDATAGISAIRTAVEMIATGAADLAIVVAAEEADWIACKGYGLWGLARNSGDSMGAVFSEGAAAVVIGPAVAGAKSILPNHIVEFHGGRSPAARMARLMDSLFQSADPDLAVISGAGGRHDQAEEEAVAACLPDSAILRPKRILGEAMVASTLHQVVSGAFALREGLAGTVAVTTAGFSSQAAGLLLTHGDVGDY